MKHSTGKPTKAEQGRLDALHRLPCMACIQEGIAQPSRTEAHHLVDKGTRKHSGGHMATLPLCGWHHRGEPVFPMSSREMRVVYGPSLAKQKREFVATYGSERELLERIDKVLGKRRAA